MGMRTWLTNLSENGQIRLLNVQLDRLYKMLGITGDASSEPQEPIKIPTEADMFLAAHPVGEIFHTMNPENPGIRYGGEWVLCAEGRTLVGVDLNNSNFAEAGLIGGEAEHALTIDEMPRHNHKVIYGEYDVTHNIGAKGTYWDNVGIVANSTTGYVTADYNGGGLPHNNMPPYMTCYKWLRLK